MKTKIKNKQQKPKISGLYLLPLVLFGYVLLYFFFPDKTLQALLKSLSTLQHLLPIFLVIIVLMGLFTTFMNAKKMAKLLGRKSGYIGWALAVIGGILSHGSAYIWYQMLADLRERNVKDGLLVTFMYTRAIKLPWLPLMVSFFGFAFTLLLIIYIILGALMQGLIIEKTAVRQS